MNLTTRDLSILEANLARLPPPLRQAVLATRADVRLENGDSVPALRVPDGRVVPIHGSRDPLTSSRAAVAKMMADGAPPLVVTIGAGLGYLLDALEEANDTTRVLVIEPVPETALAMLARRDWTKWLQSGRLTLLVGPAYTGSAEVWRAFKTGEPTNPKTIVSPLVEREFPEEARQAKALAGKIVAGVRANEEARKQFAGRYLLNTLRNLPAIAAEGDVSSLKGAFPGVPAIVVAAGPSLDKNLAMLKALDGRALVIAVDTALRPLLAAGLRPHVVVAVDPSELNARHLHNLPDMRGVSFVGEGSLDPSVLPPFEGQTFTYHVSQHEPWPWLAGLGVTRGTLRAWGSVLTTAFDLACEAGCDPIVFAGSDLAYSGGLQYCRNTTYEPLWSDCPTDESRAERFKIYLAERPPVTEADVHGRDVLTAPHYVQFRDWIVSRAAEVAGRQVLNATGGGILHGGPIVQIDGGDVVLPELDAAIGLRQRLAAAWSSGEPTRNERLANLQAALADREKLPIDAWLRFGGDTASLERIAEVVEVTAAAVRAKASVAAHVARERERFNRAAATERDARAIVHPDYEFASTQAYALQAHALLDLMQRTYVPVPGTPTRQVVEEMSAQPARLRVLDVACGLGRTMLPLVEAGFEVDGVDFSAAMLDQCRQNPRLSKSTFFLSSGFDCGEAPAGTYDLACAHHALQRVRPRAVRQALLGSMSRALRPGGAVFIQIPFFPDHTRGSVPAPHAPWSTDGQEAAASAPGAVWCTPDELPLLYADCSRWFRDLRLQFVDFPGAALRLGLAPSIRMCQLIISGSADHALAERMFAPIVKEPAANP
jgi:SAM-dependent methyltransferase